MEAQTREANITMTTGSILVAVVFAALYVAFLVWYGGKGKPLSRAEVDALLAEISSATAHELAPYGLHLRRQLPNCAKDCASGKGKP